MELGRQGMPDRLVPALSPSLFLLLFVFFAFVVDYLIVLVLDEIAERKVDVPYLSYLLLLVEMGTLFHEIL